MTHEEHTATIDRLRETADGIERSATEPPLHWKIFGAILAILLLGIGAVVWFLWTREPEPDEAARQLIEQQDEIIGNQGRSIELLVEQVEELGGEPVVEPPVVVPGAEGPTQSQVNSAVLAFCSTGACDGPQGRPGVNGEDGTDGQDGAPGPRGFPGIDGVDGQDGEDGQDGQDGADAPPPTAEQVTAALVTYCAANSCQGEPGPMGPPGAQGETGPAPTPEQIATAITEYCAANSCVGPPGPAGPQGDTGPAGPQGEQGEPGRAPTAAEIAAAVEGYCAANNGCVGPPGPQGEQGPPGAPAREVVAVETTCIQDKPNDPIVCHSTVIYGDAG